MPAVALCLLLAAPAPFAKVDRRSDRERMQGDWAEEAVYVWRPDGWRAVVSDSPPAVCVLGSCFVDRHGVEPFTLRRGSSPRGIDLTSYRVEGVWRGVYSLQGDTLTVVLARPGRKRPASLDEGNVKVVYRRKR